MLAYMDMVGIVDLDERVRFVKMIKALDRVYVRYMADKMKQEREKRRSKARPARRGRRPR